MNKCLSCIHYEKCAKELAEHGCPIPLEKTQLFDCCIDFIAKDENHE